MSSSDHRVVLNPVSLGALHRAWDRVRARGSAPGIDRETVVSFSKGVQHRLDKLHAALVSGAYRPRPARRVRLPHDPDRPIAIPSVRDRVVQRAVADVLGPRFESTLSDAAWGYRIGRGVEGALQRIDAALIGGRRYYLRADVEQFFDHLDRARLLEILRNANIEPTLVRIVELLLQGGVVDGQAFVDSGAGVGQGSALSPLLANLYLCELDALIEGSGHTYLRYADDLLVLSERPEGTAEALAQLERGLEACGLRLNPRKTRRGHLSDGLDFLGAHFDATGRTIGTRARRALAEAASRCITVAELGSLGATWTRWYGPLRPATGDSVALVAVGALADEPSGVRSAVDERWITARLDAPKGELPAEVHLALAERWYGLDTDDAAAAVLLDARAARRGGLPATQIGERLGWPAGAARCLEVGHGAAATELASRGLVRLAAAAKARCHGRSAVEAPTVEVELGPLCARLAGRLESHLLERVDGRSHLRFCPIHHALDVDALRSHLEGRSRRAVRLIGPGDQVNLMMVKVRPTADARTPRSAADGPRLRQLTSRAADHAQTIVKVAAGLDWAAHVETDPKRGCRVWFFLDRPLPVYVAARALWKLLFDVGDAPTDLQRLSFPDQDRYASGPGPWVELPLGRARHGGIRGGWLDASGRPVSNPIRALATAEPASSERIRSTLWKAPAPPKPKAVSRLSLPSEAAKIVSRCGIIGALCQKADQLGHLEGEERATLFEVFGHLPDGTRVTALRSILSPTGLSERDIVRRLRRLPDHPISCGAVRRRHALLTEEGGCDCAFAHLPRGVYPMPLLQGIELRRLPELKARLCKPSGRSRRAQSVVNTRSSDPRPTFDRARVISRPAVPSPAASASKPVAVQSAELPPVQPPPAAVPSVGDSGAGVQTVNAHDFEEAVKKLVNLREHLANTQRGLDRAEAQLQSMFEQAKTDRVRISTGWLRLHPGTPKFSIEL